MDTENQTKQLLLDTLEFQRQLTVQSRAAGKLREILEFIVKCIEFANKYLPEDMFQTWASDNKTIPLLAERAHPIFTFQSSDPHVALLAVNTTSGSASSNVFSFITNNLNFVEGRDARDEYNDLAAQYLGIVTSEDRRKKIYTFLSPLNTIAAQKFDTGVNQLASLPEGEDPQGPLMALRSALDLAMKSLLERTGLAKSEMKLKQPARLPIIAEHLAKDAESKLNLILANDQFQDLWSKLSSAKNIRLPFDQARGLAMRITALLNLMAETIQIDTDPKNFVD